MKATVDGGSAVVERGLCLEGVSVMRGGSRIIRDLDLVAEAGAVTVLLGPNGAGKTTLLEAVSGVIPAESGTFMFAGTDVLRLSRTRRARLGIAHVEQGRTVFPNLTVDENLLVGARNGTDEAYELFPELTERKYIKAELLSGGEQQMLVIARALLGEPKLLMIDEISLGLAPIVVRRLMPVVRTLASQGMAVLLVEQFAGLALDVGDRAYVLNRGRIVFSGSCEELTGQPELLHGAYLGTIDGVGNTGSVGK